MRNAKTWRTLASSKPPKSHSSLRNTPTPPSISRKRISSSRRSISSSARTDKRVRSCRSPGMRSSWRMTSCWRCPSDLRMARWTLLGLRMRRRSLRHKSNRLRRSTLSRWISSGNNKNGFSMTARVNSRRRYEPSCSYKLKCFNKKSQTTSYRFGKCKISFLRRSTRSDRLR